MWGGVQVDGAAARGMMAGHCKRSGEHHAAGRRVLGAGPGGNGELLSTLMPGGVNFPTS